MASNSWKTYKTAVDSFKTFRNGYFLEDIWPAPIDHIAKFIAYLSYKGLASSTVSTYISGLSHEHKINGWEDNTKSFFVHKLLEGLRRKRPQKPDVRIPITLEMLKKLICALHSVCFSNYEKCLFASAFSLAFFAMLRWDDTKVTIFIFGKYFAYK